ncbi:hypothetical protein K7X08_027534 [Anisodus acutangulus]|uniref:Uncharacterized protein n=1 Tax=Anisodus acutangulus TaxID=402998 RepID=A0A9Q1RL32_9SOLA|nr:hypothetical protein K7X08_027534 [Anisodus acutangulus]
MGALAWQVKIPNKCSIFVFGGEMLLGFCPGSPFSVSCPLLPSLLPKNCSLELSARSTPPILSHQIWRLPPGFVFLPKLKQHSTYSRENYVVHISNTTMDRRTSAPAFQPKVQK